MLAAREPCRVWSAFRRRRAGKLGGLELRAGRRHRIILCAYVYKYIYGAHRKERWIGVPIGAGNA